MLYKVKILCFVTSRVTDYLFELIIFNIFENYGYMYIIVVVRGNIYFAELLGSIHTVSANPLLGRHYA